MKKIITLCIFMACPLQGMQRIKQLFARACAAGKVSFTKDFAVPQVETVKKVATRTALYSSVFTTGVAVGYCATSLKKYLVIGALNTSSMEKNMDMYISLSKTLQTLSADAPELLETAQEVISDAIVFLDKDCTEIKNIIKKSPEHARIIASAALEKIDDIDTLTSIAVVDLAAFNVLKDVVCANIHKIKDRYTLRDLAAQSPEHARIIAFAALEKIDDIDTLTSIATAHPAAFNVLKKQLFMLLPQTVSTGYLRREHAWELLLYAVCFTQPYFKQVLEQEKNLNEQGYTCLYHGQWSIYGFQEDFTRDLLHELHQQGYVTEQLRPDFLYIQHRNKITVHEEEAASIIKTAKEEQQDMMQGREDSKEPARLPHRLSANLFLWGNLSNLGSCTMCYLADNTNVNKLLPPIKKDVFENLQIPSSISMRYHAELKELQQLHASLFTKGRLLQIAVPTKILDEYVYLARPGAYKTEIITKRGKQISSPRDFLYKSTTSPEEFETYNLDKGSEVAFPLTVAYALNPHSDIKIYAYDPEPQDAARYQEYIERRKALAHAIAQETAHHKSSRGKKLELCCKPLQEQFKESVKALKKED